MFGIEISEILKFTVLGSFVTVIGSLIALYLKEILAVRSFERWKARQTLIGVYRRYQLPIFLAAEEFSGRLYGLSRPNNDRAPQDIGVDILNTDVTRKAHAMVSDHYFQYRFVSNTYRLCNFLGWVELYRRDIGTLDVDSIDRNHLLESCLRNIRSTIADGWINQHSDVDIWRDCLIFREELRAIGHRMISNNINLYILDFGTFSEILRADPEGKADARWFHQAALFFDKIRRDKDFRIPRMRMLVIFLTDLMEILQPARIDRIHIKTALEWFDDIDNVTGGPKWKSADTDMNAVRNRLNNALYVSRRNYLSYPIFIQTKNRLISKSSLLKNRT